MKEAIIDNCTCPKCYSKHFDLYTANGKPVSYANIILAFSDKPDDVLELLNRYQLYKFKCSDCGKTFNIDWRWGLHYPTMEKIDVQT